MESIKHKMASLQKETRDAADVKQRLLDEASSFQNTAEKYEKLIIEINKEINSVEDELDRDLTEYKDIQEKLEVAQKESREAELQVSALRRRLALAEEEKHRCEEKTLLTQQKLEKTSELIQRYGEECKEWDDRGNMAEDGIEILEENLTEAKAVAEAANQKHEEIKRRLAVVEEEHERATDKAEECERRNREMEMRIEDIKEKTKEAEDTTDMQTEQEDKYDERVKRLTDELKEEDVRAEFGERTVEKLESTIDSLEETLYAEKLQFRSISLKLDQTLRDMIAMSEN